MYSSSQEPNKYKGTLDSRPSIKIRFGKVKDIKWDLPLAYSIGTTTYTIERLIDSGAYSSVRQNVKAISFDGFHLLLPILPFSQPLTPFLGASYNFL